MPQTQIRSTLERIGANRLQLAPSLLLHRPGIATLPCTRDPVTGVIFIDDFYVGESEYASGAYRSDAGPPDYEDFADTERRVSDFRSLYYGPFREPATDARLQQRPSRHGQHGYVSWQLPDRAVGALLLGA